MKATLALVTLLSLSSMLLLPSGSAEDIYPTLTVRLDFTDAYTDEIVVVHVTGTMVALNESGNLTLAPSNHLVEIVVTDEQHNVVVSRGAVPLFLGSGEHRFPVDPLWTSTRLNVTVTDQAGGLWAYASLKTHMSDEYLRHFIRTDIQAGLAAPVARVLGQARDSMNFHATMTFAVAALLIFLMLVLFLRIDHKRSRDMNHNSLADRFKFRVFPWSFSDSFMREYVDETLTWDVKAAKRFGYHRLAGQRQMLEDEMSALRKEADVLDLALANPELRPVLRPARKQPGKVGA